MKYLLGDSVTISSSHPSDRGTSITVMSYHTLILQEGSKTAVLTFEGEYNKNLLLEYLRVYPPSSRGISDHPPEEELELALGNDNWLAVSYDNRGEPYTRGLLVSVGAPLYSDRSGRGTVSVFIEEGDIPLLVSALRGA